MALDLARWQFAIVTVFHFFFVPMTIGLAFQVAVMQTLALVRKDETWDRLSRFFGRIFLISLAVGVVSGIVLEFEFGLNWSAFSIFVGNIFGAPLAIEGLLAFFLESTFIGLWIFGRGRLSPRVHLATIWLVSIGTVLSAFFILAANAWMQHPVGYTVDGGQAVLTNFWAVLGTAERAAFRRATAFAAALVLVTVVLTAIAGDFQARLLDVQQPMKMAAAEALYNTQNGASFSLLTIGNLSGQPVFQIRVPHLLSLIADMSWNGQVVGINQMQASEAATYGAGNYTPVLWLTYWSFRAMVGAGILMIGISAWGVWLWWRKRLAASRWFRRAAVAGIVLPIIANASGWIFTEAGRQPWIVYDLMQTAKGVSTVGAGDVALTTAGFVLVYTTLAVLAVVLVLRAARHTFDDIGEPPADAEPVPAPGLVY